MVNRKRPETEFYRSMPGKMKWPPIAEVQGKFRESAKSGYRFPQLTNMIPEYKQDMKCLHGDEFDSRDPIKMLWVLSRKVVIYNTEWVDKIDTYMSFDHSGQQ